MTLACAGPKNGVSTATAMSIASSRAPPSAQPTKFSSPRTPSRRTSGDAQVYRDLEHALAALLRTEDAALLPDGFLANIAAAQATASDREAAVMDEHAHPSLLAAASTAYFTPCRSSVAMY